MRRFLWILAVIAILLAENPGSRRLETLRPAELIYIEDCWGKIRIRTDLGDTGLGESPAEAVEDMKKKMPGHVLLDTVDLVIVDREELLDQMPDDVRPGSEACLGRGSIEPKTAAAYLKVHSPGVTLLDRRMGTGNLRTLIGTKGGYVLGEGEADREAGKAVASGRCGSSADPGVGPGRMGGSGGSSGDLDDSAEAAH